MILIEDYKQSKRFPSGLRRTKPTELVVQIIPNRLYALGSKTTGRRLQRAF